MPRDALMFVEVTLGDQSEASTNLFEQSVRLHPDIVECYAITGVSDYLIVIASASFGEAARLYSEVVTRLPGVKKIRSVFSLRSIRPGASRTPAST